MSIEGTLKGVFPCPLLVSPSGTYNVLLRIPLYLLMKSKTFNHRPDLKSHVA